MKKFVTAVLIYITIIKISIRISSKFIVNHASGNCDLCHITFFKMLLLAEEKLKGLTEEKKTLFLLQWLQQLPQTLSSTTRVSTCNKWVWPQDLPLQLGRIKGETKSIN